MGTFSAVILAVLVAPAQAEGPLRLRPLDGPRHYVGQAVRFAPERGLSEGAFSWAPPNVDGTGAFDLVEKDPEGNLVLVPRRAGRLRVPALKVRTDRGSRATAPLVLAVDPVPLARRPSTFRGGVGTFELELVAEPAVIRLGEQFDLTLRMTGPGALGTRDALDAAKWLGGEAFLRVDPLPSDTLPSASFERRWIYRVRPAQAGGVQVPSVAVSSFDPASRLFLTKRAGPITIQVQPIPEWTPAGVEGDRVRVRMPPVGEAARLVLPVLLAGLLIVLGSTLWRRARRSRQALPGDGITAARRALGDVNARDPVEITARNLIRVLALALDGEIGQRTGLVGAEEAARAMAERTRDGESGRRAARLIRRLESSAYSNPERDGDQDRRDDVEELRAETTGLLDALEHGHAGRATSSARPESVGLAGDSR